MAVALRMLPVADGSDMGGSLRNPAAFNNVYGFRPSLGRVPSLPSVDVFWKQLGTEGPIARSPDDLARLLAVQAGADARTPLSLEGAPSDPDTLTLAADIAGLRIGWLGSIWPDLPLEGGIVELCRRGLQVFADGGCHVADARLAFARERSWRAWTVLRQLFVGGMLGAAYDDPAKRALLKPEAVWEIEGHRRLQASDVYRASIDARHCSRRCMRCSTSTTCWSHRPRRSFPSMPRCTGRAASTAWRWTPTTAGWRSSRR